LIGEQLALQYGSDEFFLNAELATPGGRGMPRWLLRPLTFALLLLCVLIAGGAAARERLLLGMQMEPPILDPTVAAAAPINEVVYGNVFECLVRLRPDGRPGPGLAESWEVAPDGLSYVFHLRPGVRFHDGAAFDARSAAYTLDRARATDSTNPQKQGLAAIQAVTVVDDLTLALRLQRRSSSLLQTLGVGALAMVAPASAARNPLHPVGTGPYRFAAWRRGDAVELERNPDYWGLPARIPRLVFKFIGEPAAAYAALMAGDIDAFPNYPSPENLAQFKADPRFSVFVGGSEGETILAINNRREPLNSLRVRQAISHALDRSAIIDGAMYGYGEPIGSHFPPGRPASVDLTGLYAHDESLARRKLSEAGYVEGFPLSLKLPPTPYARRAGEIVAAQLGRAGIRVRIENLEWAQWLDQVFTRHDFDLSIVVHAEPFDYQIYGRDDYYFGYSSSQLKALLAQLEEAGDEAERDLVLRGIQGRIAADAVNGFLFQYPKLGVWDARLKGMRTGGVVDGNDVAEAWFDEARSSPERTGENPSSGSFAIAAVGWSLLVLVVALAWRCLGPSQLARRLATLALTLAAASAVVFVALQIAPGDPARYMLGINAAPEAVEALRQQMGLDASAWQRYGRWVSGLATGDFGTSYTYRVPVAALIGERLQVSLPLAIYALLLALLIAVPVGLLAAARRNRPADFILSSLSQLGIALPNFWFGMLLVMVFAIGLRWTSAGGFPGWEGGLWPALKALTLPALALAVPQAAILARVLRSAILEILPEEYMRTARAKGLSREQAILRHALPNALIPVLTILGMQFSFLLAGAVIIENVFYLPGLGRLVFQAISQRDLIVVQGVVLLLVGAVVTVSFLVDIAYGLVDPRLRQGRGS
jgi:ABC-type dipeptide/oligopeptide/nickel transport system permease component/ABC-type transport system substrate-binding protein